MTQVSVSQDKVKDFEKSRYVFQFRLFIQEE